METVLWILVALLLGSVVIVVAGLVDRRAISRDAARTLLEWPDHGRSSKIRSSDGTLLRVQTFGPESGPTLVLLHGWMEDASFWVRQVRDLPDVRIVVPDLRGHGASEAARGHDYSMAALAADVDAVLASCAPAEHDVYLAGHSLGAMTIVAWAGAHPGAVESRVTGTALVNGAVSQLVGRSRVVVMPTPLRFLITLFGPPLMSSRLPIPRFAPAISRRVVRYIVTGKSASPATLDFATRMFAATPRVARGRCGATLANLAIGDGLVNLAVPTVVIAGDRDRLLPLAHASEMADALPNLAGYTVVRNAGHMTPLTHHDLVTQALRTLVSADRVRTATAPVAPVTQVPELEPLERPTG